MTNTRPSDLSSGKGGPMKQATPTRSDTLTEEAIQETFQLLGLADPAKREQLLNLRALAAKSSANDVRWTTADSVSEAVPDMES